MNDTMKLDPFLKTHLNRQLLRHSAGRAIFCPGCQRIMDWSRTVVVSFHTKGACIKTWTLCSTCFDKRRESFTAGMEQVRPKVPDISMEIVDGREYAPKRARKPRSAAPDETAHFRAA